MNRRALFATASALAASRALAQPLPRVGPVGGQWVGGGPLWSLSSGPPGKTLDLSFMNPGTLDPSIIFTRGSTATYFDVTGAMQTVSGNTPRWDYNPTTHVLNGLLIEAASTNVLLNSATLGTQSVAVTAQAYSLSFYGTGTITKSGTAVGALVGTGAFPTRVSQTFTPTAGTLTLTVTGSVLNAQLEAGVIPTSYIPTTAAAVTRSADVCSVSPTPWYVAQSSSLVFECMVPFAVAPTGTGFITGEIDDGGVTNCILSRGNAGTSNIEGRVFSANNNAGGVVAGAFPGNAVIKHATAFGSLAGSTAVNGNAAVAFTFSPNPPAGLNRLLLGSGRLAGASLNGWMRRVQYWPRVLTNTELQSVTT